MHHNIKALQQALFEMSIPFSGIQDFKDAVMVQSFSFIRSVTPFNTESVAELCKDKMALYTVLQGLVPIPQTLGFLDSHQEAQSLDEIFRKSSAFLYPRIVKMNRGERGINVFTVSNDEEMKLAFKIIFDKSSKNYDYIALVQEYIHPVREIRVIISGGSLSFAYYRDTAQLVSGNIFRKISDISESILKKISLSWGALDFIESREGNMFFLEANTRPSFDVLVSVHGNTFLVEAYKKALKEFLKQ